MLELKQQFNNLLNLIPLKALKEDELINSNIRYVGYSAVVGEIFRGMLHKKIISFSYLLSLSYISMDVFNSIYHEYKGNISLSDIRISIKESKTAGKKLWDSFNGGTNTLVWQVLASGAIPILIVSNSIKIFSKFIFIFSASKRLVKYGSIFLGLSLILIFPKTIDPVVTKSLNTLNSIMYDRYRNL